MTIEFRIKNGMEKCLESFGFKRFSFCAVNRCHISLHFPVIFFIMVGKK